MGGQEKGGKGAVKSGWFADDGLQLSLPLAFVFNLLAGLRQTHTCANALSF